MNQGLQYKPEQNFSLLLLGQPLSGKTNVALQFPDPWIASTDRKIGNAVQRMPAGKRWFYDFIDTDDTGTPVPEDRRWERLIEVSKKAAADPNIRTLIWDNCTDIAQMLQYHILRLGGSKLVIGGEKVFEMQHWQPFRNLLSRALTVFKSVGKLFVLCAHTMTEKDEATGVITYKPLLGGQLRDSLGALFTDVWHCEIEQTAKGPRYVVRTLPTARMMLANSLGLPEVFEFSFDEIAKRLSNVK